MNFSCVENVLKAFSEGQFVIVIDDKNRENEGDLVISADKITPEAIAFMVKYTSGILCVPMLASRLNELHIPQMVKHNTDVHQTAWTISVDFKVGTSTGVSAKDRTATIQALINPQTKPDDFTRPGHIFPLKYTPGGVLQRAGHTEAAIDLAIMANCYPAAVIGEIVKEDGSMARLPDLKKFAEEHQLPLITIEEIINYRKHLENPHLRVEEPEDQKEKIQKISEATIPTNYGNFTAIVFHSNLDRTEHIVLIKGEVKNQSDVLVRIHSECLTGDVFQSKRCDCGSQLNQALKNIAEAGKGILIYVRGHEGRGIGLGEKLKAYHLQDMGLDTVQANLVLGLPIDSRDYRQSAQILTYLNVNTVRLMTNNPEKHQQLQAYGISVVERISLFGTSTVQNKDYLKTKKEKMGHLFNNAPSTYNL